MTKRVLVLNGPNLNLLGTREPGIYGSETLKLVTWIQDARKTADGILINPAAYSHTSVAISDALKAVGLPVAEVHITNIHQREAYRHHSYVSSVAFGVICGFGTLGYKLALAALAEKLK
jgi:3-dehydroquinate dehydratase-2